MTGKLSQSQISAEGGGANYEELSNISLGDGGARAIIAIHSSRLGPAAGGFHIRPGCDQEKAVQDASRLSQRATYRNALANLPCGGGQAIVLLSAASKQSALHNFSHAVDELGGRYRFMDDQASQSSDLNAVFSKYLREGGFSRRRVTMNIARWAALSAFVSIQATLRWWLGKSLAEARVAVEGAGPMASELCRLLVDAGARIIVCDRNSDHAHILAYSMGAGVARAEEIHRVAADVFAPCTMGRVLDEARAGQCNASIVCGPLEDQLAGSAAGRALHASGILYCPDYIVSAGGAIGSFHRSAAAIHHHIGAIPRRLLTVLEQSAQQSISPERAAENMALSLLESGAASVTRRAPSAIQMRALP